MHTSARRPVVLTSLRCLPPTFAEELPHGQAADASAEITDIYPATTPNRTIIRALTVPKPLFKSGAHLNLKTMEVKRLNGKVKALRYDTRKGSMNDLIRFAKANRAFFSTDRSAKGKRVFRFLDGFIDQLLKLQGSCHDPRVLTLNEKAINARLEADMNAWGRGGSAPPGMSVGLTPYYIRILLDAGSTSIFDHYI